MFMTPLQIAGYFLSKQFAWKIYAQVFMGHLRFLKEVLSDDIVLPSAATFEYTFHTFKNWFFFQHYENGKSQRNDDNLEETCSSISHTDKNANGKHARMIWSMARRGPSLAVNRAFKNPTKPAVFAVRFTDLAYLSVNVMAATDKVPFYIVLESHISQGGW